MIVNISQILYIPTHDACKIQLRNTPLQNNVYLPSSDPLRVPNLMVDRVTNSAVEYQVQRNDAIANPLIAGYEVIRFGVTMIGKYVNANRGGRVTIIPAVPGAQYRITAWALLGDYNGNRSAISAVVNATTEEASKYGRHKSLSLLLAFLYTYMIATIHSCKEN